MEVQRTAETSMFDKILDVKIMGLSIPVYLVLAVIVLFAAQTEILPTNMVGALAVMIVLGSVFNLLGSKIPIVRSYLGGGAVFCIFASSALVITTCSVCRSCFFSHSQNCVVGILSLSIPIRFPFKLFKSPE